MDTVDVLLALNDLDTAMQALMRDYTSRFGDDFIYGKLRYALRDTLDALNPSLDNNATPDDKAASSANLQRQVTVLNGLAEQLDNRGFANQYSDVTAKLAALVTAWNSFSASDAASTV